MKEAILGFVLAATAVGTATVHAASPPWQLPEALRVMSVRGGEVCFESSPRINWLKTAQIYFKEFPLYRPDAERVKAGLSPANNRAVFEYPAALPFPKGFQRYFALGIETVHEVNPVRAVGSVTYQTGRDGGEVVGPWLAGIVCGPAVARKAVLPDELAFIVATRPDARLERIGSELTPLMRDAYELQANGGKWRFYADDLSGRLIERGYAIRVVPTGQAFYVAQMGPEAPGASSRCRATWRIYELTAQPILRAQQNYGCV